MGVKSKLLDLSDTNKILKYTKLNYWRVKNLWGQRKIEKGIEFRNKGMEDPRYTIIKKFADCHHGERCFIIATGPSLSIVDIEKLNNEVTFGMNSICKLFGQTFWRPTYYGIQDRQVYEKLEAELIKNFDSDEYNDRIFVADELSKYYAIPDRFIQFPYNGNYHIYGRDYDDYYVKFSDNAYQVVYDGYTITYSLIEIAVYMGFKEIYLLGTDCLYNSSGKNHVVESGFIPRNHYQNAYERLIVGYNGVKKYMDSHDVNIYNATRGGALEVFPRVEFDQLTL